MQFCTLTGGDPDESIRLERDTGRSIGGARIRALKVGNVTFYGREGHRGEAAISTEGYLYENVSLEARGRNWELFPERPEDTETALVYVAAPQGGVIREYSAGVKELASANKECGPKMLIVPRGGTVTMFLPRSERYSGGGGRQTFAWNGTGRMELVP